MPSTRPTSDKLVFKLNRHLQVARKDDGNRVLAPGIRRENSFSKPLLIQKVRPNPQLHRSWSGSCGQGDRRSVEVCRRSTEVTMFVDWSGATSAVRAAGLIKIYLGSRSRLVWDACSKGEMPTLGCQAVAAAASGRMGSNAWVGSCGYPWYPSSIVSLKWGAKGATITERFPTWVKVDLFKTCPWF
jgi:hypothetical protein